MAVRDRNATVEPRAGGRAASRAGRARRTAGLAVLLTAVLLACPWRSQAESAFPGLPEPAFQPASYFPVSQASIAETAKAGQWVLVPELSVTSWSGLAYGQWNPKPGVEYRQAAIGDTFFVSPPGAPAPYGYLPPLRVRTVGFGLLPVEATVRISQRRANGVPIPFHAELAEDRLVGSGDLAYSETHLEDAFEVEIIKVLVDGVDVGLQPGCRTVRPAPVKLTAPAYIMPFWAKNDPKAYFDTLDPATYYNPIYGGQLSGTMDIPPFTGCLTKGGDDLSAMLTLSGSGPGNRMIARTNVCEALPLDEQGRSVPLPTGQYTPALSGCAGPEPLDYPDRPAD